MKIKRDKLGQYAREFWLIKFVLKKLSDIHNWARPYGVAMSWFMGIYLLVIFGGLIGMHSITETTQVLADESVKVDRLEVKVRELKDGVLDELKKCESRNFTDDDSPSIVDNNQAGTLKGENILSHGLYMFKVGTVKDFVKKRDGVAISTKEAKFIALDEEKARALADYAIFETTGGIFHWENCALKHGLVDKVTFIKSLY